MNEYTTELWNRRLRFDGASIMHPDYVAEFMCIGVPTDKILVTEMSEDVVLFNEQVDEKHRIITHNPHDDENIILDFSWTLPDKYTDINLPDYTFSMFETRLIELGYSEEHAQIALDRIEMELNEIERRGLTNLFKTIIYTLDIFSKNKVVWGVGRGSSCASYILFLFGLHHVDCVLFDVPMEEFFHD